MLISDCLSKLESNVEEYYMNSDEEDIIRSLNIGYSIITSTHYINKTEENRNNILEDIEKLEYELKLERSRYHELELKRTEDNRLAIEIGLDQANKTIKILEMHNSVLVVEKSELKENLYNKDIDLTNLKCKLSTSKTKGEMSEQNLREILDSSGYRCEKRGNHAGDLWIYSREDKLVCILEIKNYGSENKSKLGINGSETKKMYNDIETQLTIDNRINVPWLFISMGCEIPNSESLRKTHLGVKCYYLSMPTSKELIIWIDFCETINELNNSKNDVNLIYIQQKITEIEEIFSNLLEKRPNFKTLKDNVNKLSSSLDKEEKRFNKILEDSVKRMNQINKSIMLDDNSYNNDVNLMLNIDELSHNEIKVHVK